MKYKNSKLVIAEDESVKQAYQKYQFLKQEVDTWQQERSSYWLNNLTLAENPPYLPITELPSEAIVELWQRLNSTAEVEISDSELREIWEQFRKSQHVLDEEMAVRFQMAIRGVAHLASQMANEKKVPVQKSASDDAHNNIFCPVCGEVSILSVLTPPNGKRIIHCTSCSFEWPANRVGCVHCGNQEAKKQIYLKNEEFPGIELAVCQVCGKYFKEIDARELYVQDYMWEDLRTLPLNFAAELWLSEQAKKNNQIH